jgi:DNA-binding MarR family transcriptional regulator
MCLPRSFVDSTISDNNDRARYTYPVTSVTHEVEQQPRPRVPRELLASTGFLLGRLGYGLKARSIKEFELAGFSPYYYTVLALLDEGACQSQATMAESLRLDRSQLVGLLDELEERGLIDRRRDRTDRRRHVVSLTEDGRGALATCRAIVERLEDEFLAPLDEESRQTLHALLLELAGHADPRYACAEPRS